jgi:[ribosomal protein S5]-alanine N-acetyltransferase
MFNKEKLIPFPVVETKRLILRKFELSDAAGLFDIAKDPLVTVHLAWEPHTSEQQSLDFIKSFIDGYAGGDCGHWAIIRKEGNTLLGMITIRPGITQPRAEVGYWIGTQYWNQGFMTETLAAFIDLCFTQLGLHRIQACHFVENPASGKVMEKVGMLYEGLLHHYIYNKGHYHDVKLYAIINEKDA